jgi:hypothetical protein
VPAPLPSELRTDLNMKEFQPMNPISNRRFSMRKTLSRSVFATALGASLVLASSSASAQEAPPDPFEDYQAVNPAAPKVEAVAPPKPIAPPPQSKSASSDDVALPWKQGQFLGGIGAAFSYTSAKNEVISGADASNSNLFTRFQLHGSYTLIDRLQVGAALGLMAKSLGRTNGEKATELNGLFEINATYMIPITSRLGFAPGVGLGMYLGSSSRDIFVSGTNGVIAPVSESTGTLGFHASLNLLLAYQLSTSFQLRTGLMLTGLVGRESVSSADASLGSSAFHIGLPIQVNYTF